MDQEMVEKIIFKIDLPPQFEFDMNVEMPEYWNK